MEFARLKDNPVFVRFNLGEFGPATVLHFLIRKLEYNWFILKVSGNQIKDLKERMYEIDWIRMFPWNDWISNFIYLSNGSEAIKILLWLKITEKLIKLGLFIKTKF